MKTDYMNSMKGENMTIVEKASYKIEHFLIIKKTVNKLEMEGNLNAIKPTYFKKSMRIPLLHSRSKIWFCHCSGSGTSTCCRCRQKKKKSINKKAFAQ